MQRLLPLETLNVMFGQARGYPKTRMAFAWARCRYFMPVFFFQTFCAGRKLHVLILDVEDFYCM